MRFRENAKCLPVWKINRFSTHGYLSFEFLSSFDLNFFVSELFFNLSYDKSFPVTSIDRGFFVSATWGKHNS